MERPLDRKAPEGATNCIFIVGVSRSGTTLMRRVLNASDYIAISFENHFFGHLISTEGMRHKFRKFGDLSDDNNVRKLVDQLYSPEFQRGSLFRKASTQWRWITSRIDKEVLLQKILASDRSEKALFTIMMQVYADRRGRPIMGDKTPIHIRYVPTILTWFPDGRIVHMLRDPRGNFVSELRRRQINPSSLVYRLLRRVPALLKLFILIQTTLLWRESVRLALKYQRRYPNNYYLQRFEDLVTDPERHIRQLCAYLGVPFQESMLNMVVCSIGFTSGQEGFDPHAADRWRNYIGKGANWWFRLCFGKYLRRFGYQA